MLEILEAERFDEDASGGATIPAKMGCYGEDRPPVDAFVKFSSPQCPPGGLAREVVGCLLAERLGLTVGRPALVNVDSALIEAIRKVSPSTSARMRGSVKPAFGSIALGPGFVRCDGIDEGNAALRRAAIDIWAFDQLILNPDRNATKPNCLVRGDVLAVIDHEKALNSYGVGGLVPAPWQDNWTPDPRHLFSSVVSVGALELEPLERSWQTVTSENLDQILAAVPSSWDVAGVLREIREYLDSLLGNLKEAFGNLRKVAS